MERQLSEALAGIDPGHRRRYEFAATKVSGRVLDAACGCGYGSRMLYDAGCEVTGIDLEPTAIDFAERHYPGPYYKLWDVQTGCGIYDWVVSFETIEHVPEPELMLKAFRASRNLIISSPNSDHYKFKPERYEGDSYPHLRHYSPKELEDLLKDCGWEVLERWGQRKKIKEVTKDEGPFQVLVCR